MDEGKADRPRLREARKGALCGNRGTVPIIVAGRHKMGLSPLPALPPELNRAQHSEFNGFRRPPPPEWRADQQRPEIRGKSALHPTGQCEYPRELTLGNGAAEPQSQGFGNQGFGDCPDFCGRTPQKWDCPLCPAD